MACRVIGWEGHSVRGLSTWALYSAYWDSEPASTTRCSFAFAQGQRGARLPNMPVSNIHTFVKTFRFVLEKTALPPTRSA